MDDARTIDVIVAEMLSVTHELAGTDTVDDRLDLNDRLQRLRAEAAEARGPEVAAMSGAALAAAIARCHAELDDLRERRFDISAVGGSSGYGGGLDPLQTMEHNREVDELGGRDRLESELAATLAERDRRERS